jgi:hypothetical protein
MGGLFGGGSAKAAPAPTPTPVTRLPDTEDPSVKDAQRRAAMAAQARSGRAATVLTSRRSAAAANASASPGTQAYSNTLLGQAN